MDALARAARKTIQAHSMIRPGEQVTAGVSGGPDSVALVRILNDLRDELDFKLTVCHIHHGLRGEEADGDAEFVSALAGELSIPFMLKKIDVGESQKTSKLSLQETARELRYAFFLT